MGWQLFIAREHSETLPSALRGSIKELGDPWRPGEAPFAVQGRAVRSVVSIHPRVQLGCFQEKTDDPGAGECN